MTNLRPNRTIVKALSQKKKGGRGRGGREGGEEGGRRTEEGKNRLVSLRSEGLKD